MLVSNEDTTNVLPPVFLVRFSRNDAVSSAEKTKKGGGQSSCHLFPLYTLVCGGMSCPHRSTCATACATCATSAFTSSRAPRASHAQPLDYPTPDWFDGLPPSFRWGSAEVSPNRPAVCPVDIPLLNLLPTPAVPIVNTPVSIYINTPAHKHNTDCGQRHRTAPTPLPRSRDGRAISA